MNDRRASPETTPDITPVAATCTCASTDLGLELRQLVTSITTALSVMSLTSDPQVAKRAREAIARQLAFLTRISDNIVHLARLERDTTLDRSPIFVEGLIAAASRQSQELLAHREQLLNVRLPAHPLVVDGDMARLAFMVENLLRYVACQTEPGSIIHLVVEQENGIVAFRLWDSSTSGGPEPFTDAFRSFWTDEAEPITFDLALGLRLARRIAALHDGTIEVHQRGEADTSAFVVTLPLRRTDPLGALCETAAPLVAQSLNGRVTAV